MGNYKGINQKALSFHAEEKQKNYKEEKKSRSRMCFTPMKRDPKSYFFLPLKSLL